MSKFVYFMRPVGHVGPIKIGCSKSVGTRLDVITRWSPLKLEIIAAVPGTHAAERTLHGMFHNHWLHHEWFDASKELLALVAHVQETGALPELPKVLPFRLPQRPGAGRPPMQTAPKEPPATQDMERVAEIRRRRDAGESFASIGKTYGITRQRIFQILHRGRSA